MSIDPAAIRPAYWSPFVEAAKQEKLVLQVCGDCSSVKYPPSETCAECLGDKLEWQSVDGRGKVLAVTEVLATPDDFYRGLLPLAMGSVKLLCGHVVFAFFPDAKMSGGDEVTVVAAQDVRGAPLLLAHDQDASMTSESFDWHNSSLEKLFKV